MGGRAHGDPLERSPGGRSVLECDRAPRRDRGGDRRPLRGRGRGGRDRPSRGGRHGGGAGGGRAAGRTGRGRTGGRARRAAPAGRRAPRDSPSADRRDAGRLRLWRPPPRVSGWTAGSRPRSSPRRCAARPSARSGCATAEPGWRAQRTPRGRGRWARSSGAACSTSASRREATSVRSSIAVLGVATVAACLWATGKLPRRRGAPS